MPNFIRCIYSDLLKFKHTSILWIHLLMPLTSALLFTAYYSVSSWTVEAKISGYFEVIGIALPLMIGLITGKAGEQEGQAGNFQSMLCSIKSRTAAYASKLVVLLLLGTLSIIIAVGVFAVGFQQIPTVIYVKAAGLLICGSAFLYILHLFVSLRYGMGVSIGLGIIESLISALALTGLGDGRWYYIPCTWSARLCDNLVYTWINPSKTLGYEEIQKCLMVVICSTIVMLIINIIWFKRWEGRKAYE